MFFRSAIKYTIGGFFFAGSTYNAKQWHSFSKKVKSDEPCMKLVQCGGENSKVEEFVDV